MFLRNSGIKGWHAALAMALGGLATFAALYLAIYLVGPTIRVWLGVPEGFDQDFATKKAWWQARAIQLLSLGLVFFLVGLTSSVAKSPKQPAWSFWTANPFSVGFAYWVFQSTFSSRGPGEYFGDVGLVLLSLLSPLILAPCMLLGTRLGNHLRSNTNRDSTA